MQLATWFTSASLSVAVIAAAMFPPLQANEQALQRNQAELEQILVTCGNKAGDLRHPEAALCLQWWSARQGGQGSGTVCGDCLRVCAGADFSTCLNQCQNACGSPTAQPRLQEKMTMAEKTR